MEHENKWNTCSFSTKLCVLWFIFALKSPLDTIPNSISLTGLNIQKNNIFSRIIHINIDLLSLTCDIYWSIYLFIPGYCNPKGEAHPKQKGHGCYYISIEHKSINRNTCFLHPQLLYDVKNNLVYEYSISRLLLNCAAMSDEFHSVMAQN